MISSPACHVPRQCPAERERERRHVRPEDRGFRRIGSQQIGHGRMRRVEQRVTLAAGGEPPAMIGVRFAQIPAHRLDHALAHLAAGRAVEKHGRLAVE